MTLPCWIWKRERERESVLFIKVFTVTQMLSVFVCFPSMHLPFSGCGRTVVLLDDTLGTRPDDTGVDFMPGTQQTCHVFIFKLNPSQICFTDLWRYHITVRKCLVTFVIIEHEKNVSFHVWIYLKRFFSGYLFLTESVRNESFMSSIITNQMKRCCCTESPERMKIIGMNDWKLRVLLESHVRHVDVWEVLSC